MSRTMASFLPSEIGRLVYGYLQQHCNEDVATMFLNTCESMTECKSRNRCGFDSKFQNQFSLIQILNQYSLLSELIFQNVRVNNGTKCSHLNIVHRLRKLLDLKSNHSSRIRRTRERCTNVENKSSTQRSSEAPANVESERLNSNTNLIKSIFKERIDSSDHIGAHGDLNTCPQSNRTPSKTPQSYVGDDLSFSKNTRSVQQSPMWNHSVQSILAEYSPGRQSNDFIFGRSSNTKRKREETELEIFSIQRNLATNQKRKKLDPSFQKRSDQTNPNTVIAQDSMEGNTTEFIAHEISDGIVVHCEVDTNNSHMR